MQTEWPERIVLDTSVKNESILHLYWKDLDPWLSEALLTWTSDVPLGTTLSLELTLSSTQHIDELKSIWNEIKSISHLIMNSKIMYLGSVNDAVFQQLVNQTLFRQTFLQFMHRKNFLILSTAGKTALEVCMKLSEIGFAFFYRNCSAWEQETGSLSRRLWTTHCPSRAKASLCSSSSWVSPRT